jgi:hypothetical protein
LFDQVAEAFCFSSPFISAARQGGTSSSHRALARRLILIFRPARPAKSPIDNVTLLLSS